MQVYKSIAAPVVEGILEGYNGTVFAYGQTGTGKTHTMHGDLDNPGIVPRAVGDLFSSIHDRKFEQCLVRVSYCEIYNEEVRDLLAGKLKEKLEVREEPGGSPYVKGLTWIIAKHKSEIIRALQVSCSNPCTPD